MIDIYTDGASSNNQSAELREGGWAFIIPNGTQFLVSYQYAKGATNNQMELCALGEALRALAKNKVGGPIRVHTDSQYVIGALSGNKAKKNQELISEIARFRDEHGFRLEFVFVKGHAGDTFNELCDVYAKKAIAEKRTQIATEILKLPASV